MMTLLNTAKNHHRRRSLLFLLSSAAILLTTTHAFTPSQRLATPTTTQLNAQQKRINNKIDLDSPKVATMEKFARDDKEKKVYCRCWKSETFPLCDGSHMKHNKEFEDNVGPLIVTVDTTATSAADEATDREAAVITTAETSTSPLKKIKSFFKKDNNKNSDGLTTKERLAKMGLSALLSYGWVSNMSYAVTLSLSWYTHSKKTGLSPLAPNQWKPFLAV